jgi:pimeloyl-ACP methyl ester carboxylesterase
MVTPAYTMLKAKTNKTADELAQFKLLRLLVEQPHIPLSDLRKISCPSLIIGGDHDVINEGHTMQIYQNISKAWILPASGHSTPIVYRDEFNAVVDRFFSTPYRVISGVDRFF